LSKEAKALYLLIILAFFQMDRKKTSAPWCISRDVYSFKQQTPTAFDEHCIHHGGYTKSKAAAKHNLGQSSPCQYPFQLP